MNFLRKLRRDKGLSQFDLGRTVGIYPQKISDFECGRRDLRLGEAVQIAKVLNVSVNDLVGINENVALALSPDNASE